MKYPTHGQVDKASHEQLGRWMRFLPSPGMCAVGSDDFEVVMEKEALVQKHIIERFNEFGGWNPALSKKVGWS